MPDGISIPRNPERVEIEFTVPQEIWDDAEERADRLGCTAQDALGDLIDPAFIIRTADGEVVHRD
jgi:hypothetical protein